MQAAEQADNKKTKSAVGHISLTDEPSASLQALLTLPNPEGHLIKCDHVQNLMHAHLWGHLILLLISFYKTGIKINKKLLPLKTTFINKTLFALKLKLNAVNWAQSHGPNAFQLSYCHIIIWVLHNWASFVGTGSATCTLYWLNMECWKHLSL